MRNEEFFVVLNDKNLLVEVDYDVFSSDFYNPSHCEIEILNCFVVIPDCDNHCDYIEYIPSNSERIDIMDDITYQIFDLELKENEYDRSEF